MFLDLVIAACAALVAVGTVLAVYKLFRSSPPRWLLPLLAGVAMIGVTAAMRYQWADSMSSRLPPHMVVLEGLTQTTWLEPWSLVQPVTTRLIVADRASIKRHPAHPDMVMIDVLLLQRQAETLVARHLVDCAERRDAVVPRDAVFGPDALPTGLTWAADAPAGFFEAACGPMPAEPAAQAPAKAEKAEQAAQAPAKAGGGGS